MPALPSLNAEGGWGIRDSWEQQQPLEELSGGSRAPSAQLLGLSKPRQTALSAQVLGDPALDRSGSVSQGGQEEEG